MTKEQYIIWKANNPLDILYYYYKHHELLNHTPLDPQNLMMQLQIKGWNLQNILNNVIEHYDRQFELVALLDKNGQFIKYV